MVMPLGRSGMDNRRLDQLIRETGEAVEGDLGYWRFEVNGVMLYCVADEPHDRMRIMAPVAPMEEVHEDQLRACMEANFDRALDARYCVNEDTLWTAFIHPLKPLTTDQFLSAVRQVAKAVQNFGTSYSSGELIFGGCPDS